MRFILLLSCLYASLSFAQENDLSSSKQEPGLPPVITTPSIEDSLPWFTGPLLAPSGHAVPLGYFNVEPYFFYTVYDGAFDENWSFVPYEHNFYSETIQLPIWLGITPWMDFQTTVTTYHSNTHGASSWAFGDLSLQLDFQLLKDEKTNNFPGIKLYVAETIPTGKYQHLDPEKLFTDYGGSGSYQTTVGLVLTRTFHIYKEQYLALRLNGYYNYETNVAIEGLSTYGGALDTKGTVHPYPSYGGIFAFEYSFNRHVALACDFYASYSGRTGFKGVGGTDLHGNPVKVTGPASFQFSIAPAIEYNVNESLGFIAGGWVTCTGKNTSRQINGVFALNYYVPIATFQSRGSMDSHRM